jgi:3-deoxy-D-manno-octulosonate 8-phosphate phosphatase (KDO 8-P phosphatase)
MNSMTPFIQRDLIQKKFEKKLQKIRVLLTDCDGVLTNGQIWWQGEEVGWNRAFNVIDGYGIKMLMQSGIKIGIISGGDSLGLKKRCENLGVDFQFLGSEEKIPAWNQILSYGYQAHEVAYIGDDLFDLPLLKLAGFSACPPHSPIEVLNQVDYVTSRGAGMGCVREICELIQMTITSSHKNK